MTWYRHWLELRYWLIAVLGLALLSVAFAAFVTLVNPSPYDMKWLASEWPQLAHRIPEMGPVGFLLWAYHAGTSGILSLVVCCCLAGSTTGGRQQTAIYHMLSLPVPRAKWIWTRLTVTAAILAAANLVLLAAQYALALGLERPLPWAAMATSSVAATVAGAAYLAFMQLSRWIAGWWLALLSFMPLLLAPPYMHLAAVWGPLTIGFATAAMAAFALNIWAANTRDF